MEPDLSTPLDGDDDATTGDAPGGGPVSPETPAPSEPEDAGDAADTMIDVVVMGPVLGAKMGRVMSVTPEIYANYRRFLRRIG